MTTSDQIEEAVYKALEAGWTPERIRAEVEAAIESADD